VGKTDIIADTTESNMRYGMYRPREPGGSS